MPITAQEVQEVLALLEATPVRIAREYRRVGRGSTALAAGQAGLVRAAEVESFARL